MNRIYSLVFNRALRQVQVVSEHAGQRRGSTSRRAAMRGAVPAIAGLTLALALAVIPFGVSGQTLPGDYVIRDGIEGITTPAADTMVIDQGNHLRGLIEWESFDIGEGYTVSFEQLADAVALNVIGDVNPSQILGNLHADGTVFLINPNGIIFGDSASVSVGGLIASTLEVDGNAFLDGGDSMAMTSSGIPASITNNGTIVATGAQGVTLLGGHLSNTGIITAETGSINLFGTQTATLSFGTGNRLSIAVDGALTAVHNEPAVVHNNGVLNADGGRVFMHANVASGVLSNAVNHAGIITASGIDADGNGGVVLSGGGSGVVQSGSITSGADALITAEGAVSLDGDSLDVTGLTVDAGSLDIESGVDLDGNLSITVADGGISQNGAWVVYGTSTLDAGSGQIRLDNADNDFFGWVNLTGGEVTILDVNALGLGDLDVGSLAVTNHGPLDLGSGAIDGNLVANTNGGNITQSLGGLQVGGTIALDTGAGGIWLGQAGNRFDGAVQLTGSAVTIASDFDLDFGTLNVGSLGASSEGSVTFGGGSVGGSLGVTSGGDINQTGAITVGGVSTLVAQAGSIALAHSGNDFAGAVNLGAEGAAEVGNTGTLILGAVDVGSLDAVSTSIVLGGDIETDGNQRYDGAVRLAADVALASGAGDVAFAGSVDGAHRLAVNAAAGAVTFSGDIGSITALASLAVEVGSVSIMNRLVVAGDLAITTQTGGIAQGAAWDVLGPSTLDAGADAIMLAADGNDFVGTVQLVGGDVTIEDRNTLSLDALDVGALDATSTGLLNLGVGKIDGSLVAESNGGEIIQSGALDITGTSMLNAGTGSIALDNEDNRFGGAVTATGNGITLFGREDLVIAGLTSGQGPTSAVHLEAGGTLTLPGGQINTGPATLTLVSKGGELVTAGLLRGFEVKLTGADGIRLDHDVIATTLTLHSGADISQQGGVVQMDSLHVNAEGSVSLGAENQVAELGGVDVEGNFSLRNVSAISQAEETSVSIDGDASFSSGGAITLTNAGNRFGGEVGLSGGAAKISAADALRLGDLAVDSLVAGSQGALNLGRGTVVGDLEATSDGDIGQSGALTVGGTGTIAAGTGAISLDDAGNDFAGPVSLTGGAAWIRSLDDLQLGDLDVTALSATSGGDLGLGQGEVRGNLQATSTAGDIGQSGALEVDGTSILSAVDGAITLGEDNDFGDTVDLTADGDVLINARNALTLGTLAVGSLEATSDGELDLGQGNIEGNLVADSTGHAIGQTGALEVGGTSDVDAGSGAITLEQGNRFAGVVDLRGGAVVIRDTGALALGDIGVSSLDAASGGALNLGSGAITDSLDATSLAGGITQSGSLLVGGDADLSAGSGDIALDSTGNDFGGTVSLSGGAVSIIDSNTLRLGTVQASSLEATATTIQLGGDIATDGDQAYRGAVALLDDRTLESDAGDITFGSTLDGAHALEATALGTVAFQGDVGSGAALSGLDVAADGFAAAGQLNVMGPLRLDIARGGISQSAQWWVTGNVDLEAYDGAIALANPGNSFGGTVSLAGGAAAIHGGSLLTLGTVDATSLDATAVTIQLSDNVSTSDHQAYDGTVQLVDSVALESTAGDVTFGSAVYGAHALDVAAQAGTVTFTGAVGAVERLAGLTVEAGQFNALSTLDTSGDLSLTVTQGGIDQAGRWDVDGTTALHAAGDITLDEADNAFAGTMDVTGGATTIVNSGALALGTVDVASLDATSDGDLGLGQGDIDGNLVARSNGGDIGQSGALQVGGTSDLDAAGGAIALTDENNSFAGVVDLAGGVVSIRDSGALMLGSVDVASLQAVSGGALNLGAGIIGGRLDATSAAGGISQGGALEVVGDMNLAAGDGAITLVDAGNDFAGLVHLAGGATSIVDTNALALGTVEVASLDATATAIQLGEDIATGGDQTYRGAVELMDDRTLTSAAGDITFGSTVDGVYALNVDAGAGTATFNGAVGDTGPLTGLTVNAAQFSTLSTLDTSGDLVLAVTQGGIGQAGAWTVGGATTLGAGDGDITLANGGNDFIGTVNLAGAAATIVDANVLALGTVDVSSLDATATTIQLGGDIATSGDQAYRGAVALLDDRTLESGAGDISFGSTVDGAHALDVAARAGTVTFTDAVGGTGPLTGLTANAARLNILSTLDTSGDLVLAAAQGGIGQAGAWTVGGTTALDADDGAITLDDAGNDFAGTVHLAGGATSIVDANTLGLGTVDVSSLDATATAIQLGEDIATNGDQIYRGAVELMGDRTLASAAGDIAFASTVDGAHMLDAAAQAGTVTFTGAVGAVDRLTGLAVDAGQFNALSTLDTSGDLSLTVAQGGIGQAGRWDVGGATALDAAGNITLDNVDNAFAGTVDLAGDAVTIVNSGALTLGGVDVASLDATSDGDLDLGQGNIGGDLVAYSNDGDISQSGALSVGGVGALDAGAGDITLDDAGNDFIGLVHLTGGEATIVDANAMALGDLDVASLDATSQGNLLLGQGSIAGDLVARSNDGAIGQSGALSVGGAATLDAGDGDITLDDAGNDFAGPVHLAGGETTIVDAHVLTLASVEVSSLAATAATIRLGADVTTPGNQAYSGAVELLDDRTLASGAGDITFGSTVDGAYALDVTAGAVTFTGAVGGADPLTGLAVDAGRFNALSTLDTSGDLMLTVAEGGIEQSGAWSVGGTGTLEVSEGDITLGDAGNAFAGTVNLAGDETTIVNSGALTLGAVDVASLDATSIGDLDLGQGRIDGDLVAHSNDGGIGQTGALYVGGTGTLEAGDGDIALDDAGNDFAGAVHLAGGAASIVDANALALGGLDVASLDATSQGELLLGHGSIAGDLVARSNDGAIGQSGALYVGGTGTLDAGVGDITLDDAGNDFAGLVHLAGGAASVVDANALALGDVDVASLEAASHGDLGLGSGSIAGGLAARSNGGDIEQSGALAVGGTGTLDAGGGAITLDDAGNDFAGLVHLAGGAVSIVDANALALGDLDVASLAVTSRGDLSLGSGAIAGDLVARSNGGAIGQSGGLRVEGQSSLAAGAGAIALEDKDNAFVGAVDVAGTGIAMFNATDLRVASLDSGGGAVSLVADGDLTLPTHAIDTGGADLRLAALGGALSAGGALSGGEVSLQGRDGIGMGGDVTALGTLRLESDGAVTRTGGVLTAQTLTGRVAGPAMLGDGNAISELGAFNAGELELGTAGPLTVAGPVDAGSRLALRVDGDLAIHEQVSADTMRLDAAGAIGLDGDGRIVAATLSGSAGGPTTLGSRDRFVDNQVDVLGDFTSHAGFSMTNAGTLTLASVGGSEYSIDAGTAVTYLSIADGDLLQEGTTPIRNGTGFYASTGHIGMVDAPIHVIGVEQQTVDFIGLPPAYFYATRADGTLLPVVGANAVNVPVSLISSRVQRSGQGEVEYVDLGADASGYRAYGIVQPGIRLPDDQRPECDPDFPGPECIDA